MASEVISFRFSEAEIQALSAFQQPDDKSISQTAARLVREMLAGNNPDLYTESPTKSTTVNNVDKNVDKEEIKSAVLAEIIPQVNQILSEFREEILGK
jgi:uncharacterized protein YaaN involved in tellurite resistance